MDTPPTAPQPSAKPDLSPSGIEGLGVMFSPGWRGNMIHSISLLWAVILAAICIKSWLEGPPIPGAQIGIRPLAYVWCMLTLLNYHCIRKGKRQPWLYWLTVICIAGWSYIAFTSHGSLLGFSEPRENGQWYRGWWIPSAAYGYMLLRFALSRKNRLYFGLLKA